jgi:hypothetical protein
LWGGDGLYISNWQQFWAGGIDGADIGEINFKNFTNNARIEIHGCNGAKEELPNDNIVHDISILLFNSGKDKSYAIGHTTKNNPNIKGGATKINEQDYRHNRRAIYHNGSIINKQSDGNYSTKQKGHLDEAAIEAKIP